MNFFFRLKARKLGGQLVLLDLDLLCQRKYHFLVKKIHLYHPGTLYEKKIHWMVYSHIIYRKKNKRGNICLKQQHCYGISNEGLFERIHTLRRNLKHKTKHQKSRVYIHQDAT